MSSVTLEALTLIALGLTLTLSAYTSIAQNSACTLSYNPLTEINNAIQAAYAQPYTQMAVTINATLAIKVGKNTFEYYGCKAPQPVIADPNSIVVAYNSNSVEYALNFRQTVLDTPCTLTLTYNPFNKTVLVQC